MCENGRVVSQAVVIAVGVRASGEREVLGVDVGPSEDGAFWLQFLRSLVARGLAGGSGRCPVGHQRRPPGTHGGHRGRLAGGELAEVSRPLRVQQSGGLKVCREVLM